MTFTRLLAKSRESAGTTLDAETLPGHTRNVLATAAALVDTIGPQSLDSLGLTHAFSTASLQAALLRAALLHDMGKANSEFQQAVRHAGTAQSLRHEWVSAWLVLRDPQLDKWLFADCAPHIRHASLYAVLGHHLKLKDASDIEARPGSGNTRTDLVLDHDDFGACLTLATTFIGLPPAPTLQPVSVDLCSRPLGGLRSWLGDDDWWADKATTEERRFVALVKALLISADVAGSAIPRGGESPANWTRSHVTQTCSLEELKDVVVHDLKGHEPWQFQTQVAESPGRITFVRAGCASGKTAAAYMWAQRRAVGRKLFFCYPTTGTTTEGFRSRIKGTEAVGNSQLKHGRSAVDIELLLEDRTADVLERAKRYESLTTWHTPITLCTVDYVLGLIQNYRSALFSFPGIANGAFVFDEVHQYGDRLFAELLRFIDTFRGTPVLLMTATLPRSRLDAIRQAAAATGAELHVVDGPAELEGLPRYELAGITDDPPWNEVDAMLTSGGKALWVVNTVNRSVGFAQAAGDRNALLYHSRYRYVDRLKKHAAVMTAFDDDNQGAALAVTTQVCEDTYEEPPAVLKV